MPAAVTRPTPTISKCAVCTACAGTLARPKERTASAATMKIRFTSSIVRGAHCSGNRGTALRFSYACPWQSFGVHGIGIGVSPTLNERAS